MEQDKAITIVDRFEVNTIVWLRSLPEAEVGPSRRMTEDLEALALTGAFAFEVVDVSDRATMLNALAAIATRCAGGLRPILQFDCHGSAEDGLALAPSGEYLAWDALAAALRPLNVASANNTCCIFGVCFGLHLSLSLRLSLPSPYFLTIAPEREVTVGELLDRLAPFYARLYETGNITQAYKEHLAPALSVFYCTKVLAQAFATYIVNHASGAGAAVRREDMLTRALEAGNSPAQIAALRKRLKEALRPTQTQLDHFANSFLIGRKPGFGIDEVERLATGMRRRRENVRRDADRRDKLMRGR